MYVYADVGDNPMRSWVVKLIPVIIKLTRSRKRSRPGPVYAKFEMRHLVYNAILINVKKVYVCVGFAIDLFEIKNNTLNSCSNKSV